MASLNISQLQDNDARIADLVRDEYSKRARAGSDTVYCKTVAKAFGYADEDLISVPEGANLGLSCGNPLATASIKEGEVVVDLGSGGGLDVFLAAARVGQSGQAIGLDLSSDMISLARSNAKKRDLRPPHVAFLQASLCEELPLVSSSVDCLLSNCVINLLPPAGKSHLMKEAFRILKCGGRVAFDDIVAKSPLPDDIRKDISAYLNCISGSITENEYRALLEVAGFKDIVIVDTKRNLNIYYQADSGNNSSGACCSTSNFIKPEQPSFDVNKWAAAYHIYAVKDGVQTSLNVSALQNWWDAYPFVKSSPSGISQPAVVAMIRDSSKNLTDFAIIDVRRNDHAGGHVKGSHQWAAQTFYDDLPAFFEKFRDTKQVIFYCNRSTGRGPRCAGWYQDYLDASSGHNSTAYILQGGIKAWLENYSGQSDLVDIDD